MDIPNTTDGIAIIGLAGKFPGANNVAQFWANLCAGSESITRFSDEQLLAAGITPAEFNDPSYVRARAVLDRPEWFDAAFFGLSPREAELVDPQQRLFLEACWEAFEDAGYDPQASGGSVGVFASASLNTYWLRQVLGHRGGIADFTKVFQADGYDVLLGADKDYLATRVAFKLNLHGPAVTLQTACSSSLVAISQACASLQAFQCDRALAGGVSVSFPQERGHFYQEGAIPSADGTCRAFDAAAQGTVFGAGCGVVLLKRLDDALTDGDQIYAVIRSTALNNDGARKASYTAPSQEGQSEVIALAQALAGIPADTISYVEAHGTGTPVGDPIEVAGLTQAFRATTDKNQFCGLGSLKTNVGHLEAAAGVTGVIKTALALKHRYLPPTLHFQSPNPEINFAESPFSVVATGRNWDNVPLPRRAGVSSFGVGGTNAHAVLEEAPAPSPGSAARSQHLLVLSAKTPAALETMTANLADALSAQPALELADVAFTLANGRRAFAHRRCVVATDTDEAVAKLRELAPKFVFTAQAPVRDAPVVFLFPGQGAQYVDMGRALYDSEPVFRGEVDRCAEILQPLLGLDLRTILYPPSADREKAQAQINQTFFTQPAIFVVEYALARLWMSWDVTPSVLLGHSNGESVCAVLAGVFTLEAALALLVTRARLMQALPAGSMLAVRLSATEVEPQLPAGVSIAAHNSAKTCTVSGPTPVLEKFLADLTARKIAARLLPTSHAFHSSMMEPMLPKFTAASAKTPHQPPTLPWISSCTGNWLTPAELQDGSYWSRQIRQPVRFTEALDTLFKDSPAAVLIEIGPGQTLAQLVRQHAGKGVNSTILTTLSADSESERDFASMVASLGRLWCAGVKPDWAAFYAGQSRKRVSLPTYPFERQRFWAEPSSTGTEIPLSIALPSPAPVEPVAAMAPLIAAPAVPVIDRRDRIAAKLKTAIKDLSGIAISDDQASFIELGFDSLFLTQASQEFQRQFGLKITFRQLINELSSIRELAVHLDAKLPPEAAPAEVRPAAPAASGNVSRVTPGVEALPPGSANDVLRQLLQQQREFMVRQLPVLDTLLGPAGASAGSLPSLGLAAPAAPAVVAAAPTASAEISGGVQASAFGPNTSSSRTPEPEMTPAQRRHLDALIARYTAKTPRSKALTQKYRQWYADPRTASGFNRQWKEMCYQLVVDYSKDARIRDIDGNEYIDLLNGFGPNFLGHSPAFVTAALKEQLDRGIEVGPQSPIAGEAARLFCELTGNERASFVNTGSEAVYAAMRLARTVTGRDKIVVFNRDYHGNFDEVLVKGLGATADFRTVPSAPGIPRRAVADMYVLDYGSDEALAFIEKHAGEIAAVLVEPVQSRRPELQPKAFVKALRQLTKEKNVVLIFDEVITGLRDGPRGAQAIFDIEADIATYGKVVGGGMPIGVVAGKAEYMDTFDGGMWQYGDDSMPEKGVTFFAGTFVRHPMAMVAALAVLKFLKAQDLSFWEKINARTKRLASTVDAFFVEQGVPMRMPHFCSQMYVRVQDDNKYAYLLFFHLREKGIFFLEGFPCYLTAAHTDEDVDRVIAAFKESVFALQEAGFFSKPAGANASLATAPLTLPAEKIPAAFPPADHAAPRFPLAEGQKEMWLGAQMSPDAAGPHHACNLIDLEGPLNESALRRALATVVQRHEGLRCVFSEDGTEVIVQATLDLPVPLDDLSQLSPAERKAAAERIVAQESRQLFDLSQGPLIAFRLIRFSATHHQLVFTAQMIACDGWSHYVVFEEISAFYSAYDEGRELKLPAAIPMRDYALWQLQHQNDDEARTCEAYWLAKFTPLPPPFDLPTTGPRPPNRTVAADRREITFDPPFYTAIKSLARELKNSSFAVLLTAFQTWLYRLSGTSDLVVGVPFSAQGPLGLDSLVGQCANTLPLRARLDPVEPFTAALNRTWADLLDAQENWNYTFGKLAQQLDLPRDPSRIPLVSVLFNIDPPMSKVNFTGLKHRVISGPRVYYQYDFGFNLVETEGGLRVECDYNRNLFEGDTVQAWLASYEQLLRQLVRSPRQSLAQIPLLADNATASDVAPRESIPGEERLTVHGLIQSQIERTPDAVAAVDEKSRITYAQLDLHANLLANHLIGLGVEKNTTVAICLERTVDMVVAILAIFRTGAAYVPLSPDFPVERKAHVLTDASASIVVTHANLIDVLPAQGTQAVCLDRDWSRIKTAGEKRPDRPGSPDSLAYLIYTSGSTGLPKGVEVPHHAAVNFLLSMQRAPGLAAPEVVLALSPLSFDISVLELLLPLTVGAHSVIASRATAVDPSALSALVEKNAVTMIQATPSTWRMLLNSGWKSGRGRKLLTGGEALTPDLAAQLLATGGEVWNLYGPTETTVWSTVGRVDSTAGLSIGHPIRNTSIQIVDDFDQPVPVGVPGELLIGGSGLARGYRNLPELTAQRFIVRTNGERLYRTGDRVRRHPDGRIEYLGRRDFQVKVRGCLVELGEIEALIRQHSAVSDAAVELRDDLPGGPGLVAYFTRVPQAQALVAGLTDNELIRELRQAVRDRLPDYMRPSRWVVLARMPQSATGKLERSALPAPDATVADLADDYAGPENETQATLARIWQSTLRIGRVGIRDSFFDLGGQSLLAVHLFAQIEKEFQRKLPLSTLFKAPTIEKLAAVLTHGGEDSDAWSSLVPIQPKGNLTPLFLVHGAGGNVLLYRALAQHLTPGRPLYGLQSRGLDGKSEPLKTIEAMAEAYLAEIRSVQPNGPYLLGGYCLGGTVAYEMAQRLQHAGEKVALVAMLDTYNFSRALKTSFLSFMVQKMKFHGANFIRLRPRDMWNYVAEKIRVARDGELANILTSKPTPAEEGVARATTGPEASVQALNDHAADAYLPKYYAGRLTLFKPEANYKFYPDPNMGWSDLVDGLDLVEFPFKPHAMLMEPYVKLLGKALNQTTDSMVTSRSTTHEPQPQGHCR